MKTINYLLITGLVMTLSAFTINQSINWKISDNHSIKFSGTEVEGIFKDVDGNIQFDENDLANSKVSFSIPVNSINTGNGTKNKHAVSDKWFDAETYPNIKFMSQKFAKTSSGYKATGNMEIHGIKKEMTIAFTFENNTFKSNFSVNRLDFKVGTMKGMSKKVSDAIKLDVSIPVTK
ncbi:MAG: YceI family protein [Crocinitomicaceae bacterium]